jgi:midasin
MVLGERLRSPEEYAVVRQALESTMKVKLDMDALYDQEGDAPLQRLREALAAAESGAAGGAEAEQAAAIRGALGGVVWTRSMRRLYALVDRCLRHQEPVLLVGETGVGKTTVCQLLALMRGQKLRILNCNQHTETSDFLGGFRPSRHRERDAAAFAAAAEGAAAALAALCAALGAGAPEGAAEAAAAAEGGCSPVEVAGVVRALHAAAAAPMQAAASHDGARAALETLRDALRALDAAAAAARAPFAWADGPLVLAMRQGDMLLVDEINLAEDAVLERLNRCAVLLLDF